jgi:hypothetical protein
MCSDIANYYEIWKTNPYFWRNNKLDLPLRFANSYDPSQLQPNNCIEPWKNFITYAKYMWNLWICIGMRYSCNSCTIHIIAAYTSTNKENAGPSMSVSVYIYNYIYIFMHMDMAYATTMLPILQGAYTYCVLVARLLILYTIRFETTFSLSTNITWCLCTRSNNEDQVYTCSRRKKTTTGSLHIKHAGSCYFALCYIFEN